MLLIITKILVVIQLQIKDANLRMFLVLISRRQRKGIYCIEPDDTKAFPAFPVPGENEYLYSEDVDFNKINDDPYKRVQEETVEEKVSDLTLENLSAQVGNILDRSIKIENKFMKDYKPDDTPVSKIHLL